MGPADDAPADGRGSRGRGPVIVVSVVVVALVGAAAAWALRGDDPPPPVEASAPALDAEDEQVDEPEPAEDPGGPVDLRADVDLLELPWATRCTDSGELESVVLTEGPSRAPDDGWWSHDPDPGREFASMIYSVDPASVVYGDVTGDGADDAILRSNCFIGNDFIHHLEVWAHDADGGPLHLPPPLELSKFDGVLEAFEVVDGALRVTTAEPAPEETHPHLNGYAVDVVTDWTFVQQRWVSEVSRSDPPSSAPAPAADEPVRAGSFSMPSGNVACAMSPEDGDLVCQILSGVQPTPAGTCELDWGGAVIGPRGPAEPLCTGGLIVDGTEIVLEYGQTWTDGAISCTSAEDGLRCTNATGNSFLLSRSRSSFS